MNVYNEEVAYMHITNKQASKQQNKTKQNKKRG
jgi:hypothetical protein